MVNSSWKIGFLREVESEVIEIPADIRDQQIRHEITGDVKRRERLAGVRRENRSLAHVHGARRR